MKPGRLLGIERGMKAQVVENLQRRELGLAHVLQAVDGPDFDFALDDARRLGEAGENHLVGLEHVRHRPGLG